MRVYPDLFEGLRVQLTEMRGLVKLVPPLIEADRERRWREIGERPSDGEDGDVINVYGDEAGPEEGWGVRGLRPNDPRRGCGLSAGSTTT